MSLSIDIICRDGSPLGVTQSSINGEDGRAGIGGSELFLLTMCQLWHERGDKVTLYNDPKGGSSVFEQRRIDSFDHNENRDVLIVFRSPNKRMNQHSKGLKVWLSCDQSTVDDFGQFRQKVDKVVGISPFHADYFSKTYGINDMIVIDIPVRL